MDRSICGKVRRAGGWCLLVLHSDVRMPLRLLRRTIAYTLTIANDVLDASGQAALHIVTTYVLADILAHQQRLHGARTYSLTEMHVRERLCYRKHRLCSS
jgi:hypothetical protein